LSGTARPSIRAVWWLMTSSPHLRLSLRFMVLRQDWGLHRYTTGSHSVIEPLAWSMGSRKEAGHGRASWMVL
jgi:hypothetical protein